MEKLLKIVLIFSIVNTMLCTVMIIALIYEINTRYDSSIDDVVPTAELAESISEDLIKAHFDDEVDAEAVSQRNKWLVTADNNDNSSSYYKVLIRKSDGEIVELKYCEE